jgi:transposase-like protein
VKSNESKAILAVYAKANEVEAQGVTSMYLVILKRQGQVYTLVVDDTKANTLIPVI